MFLHTDSYAVMLLLSARVFQHTPACCFRVMFINTHAFTRRYFLRQLRYVYTEMLSHTETSLITDKYLYTEKILHRGTLHTDDITDVVLQGNAFTQGAFTYERFYTDLLLRD